LILTLDLFIYLFFKDSLKHIRDETVASGFPAIMITAPDEVALLQQLIRIGNVKNIIEVDR
jgi:predicted O-methyltransferase YrrM